MKELTDYDNHVLAINSLNRLKEQVDRAHRNLYGIELICDLALDYPFEDFTEEKLHTFINQIMLLAKGGK